MGWGQRVAPRAALEAYQPGLRRGAQGLRGHEWPEGWGLASLQRVWACPCAAAGMLGVAPTTAWGCEFLPLRSVLNLNVI